MGVKIKGNTNLKVELLQTRSFKVVSIELYI